jgi:hypothetical protein
MTGEREIRREEVLEEMQELQRPERMPELVQRPRPWVVGPDGFLYRPGTTLQDFDKRYTGR